MLASDFDAFSTAMVGLARGLRAKEPDDDDLQFYWRALKDLHVSAVMRRIEDWPKRSKFWPKPFELRPKDDRQTSEEPLAERAKIRAAIEANSENWHEMRTKDPELYRIERGISDTARLMANAKPSSPEYAEAIREDQRLRDQRLALWRSRAS